MKGTSNFLLKTTIVGVVVVLGFFYTLEIKRILREENNSWTQDHKADCAVILTGGRGRVREGFSLLAQEQIKKLIISGVNPRSRIREIFPQWPFYGDLSEKDVILEKWSQTTYGNAQQSLPLVEALHCRSVILVTSTLHMYRARKIFKSLFPSEFPIYSRSVLHQSNRLFVLDLMSEASKSLYYALWAYN